MENRVELRHDCTPFQMLTKLRLGVEEDMKTSNGLRGPNDRFKFDMLANATVLP